VLAGNVVPGGLPEIVAEADGPLAVLRDEEDPPAVIGHPHVVVGRPAIRIDADRRAQVDVVGLESLRTDVAPPLQEIRLPLLERPLQPAVAAEIDVVRDRFEGLSH